MFTLLLSLALAAPPSSDWPALIQEPYARLPVADVGLRPLLVRPDGTKVTTPAEWQAARQALLERWSARLGKAPARPAQLDVRVEKTEQGDGYQRQLLSLATEGDDRLRAYLLTPEGLKDGERRPAVIVFHPTTRDTLREPVGLAPKTWGALGHVLARRGYVVLCPECYILKDLQGWAAGQARALAQRRPGWTGMGKMVFDASRCVDYLETLPAVDTSRIGCIGFSLGAKEVLYAMAFEPRLKVGVANEPGIGLRMSNWFDAWYLTEQMRPHVPEMENHQVLALVAPRPFLLLAGDNGSGARGIADGDASWAFIHAVLPVYTLLGARDRVGMFNHRGGHDFPPEGRRVAYRWLDHWLGFRPVRNEVGE